MNDCEIVTKQRPDGLTIGNLIDAYYGEIYFGMESIPVCGVLPCGIEILRAYLGKDNTDQPGFGEIYTILRYDDRYFVMLYHVWEPHQKPHMANRMTELHELKLRFKPFPRLEKDATDFGLRAFWQHTPNPELDDESKALRDVAKVLKQYSVNQKLCKKFRTKYAKQATIHSELSM